MTWLRTKATLRRRPLERPNGRSPEASKRRNRRSPASLVLLYLALLVGAVIALFPVFVMVTGSTKTLAEVMRIPPQWIPQHLSLKNFQEVFRQQPLYWRYFVNSAVVALITVVSVLVTSSMAGYALAKFTYRGRNVIFLFILSTMMIPFEMRMVPLYVMVSDWHLTDTYLGLALPGLVGAFGIFLMRQFIASIPDDLTDAARIDGASEVGIFIRIILPLTKPALSALAIFTLVGSWEAFLWPLLIVDAESMRTLPLGLALFAGRYLQRLDLQMAASVMTVLPMVIVFFVLQRRFVEGITMTGLKG
ncbi:MAG: carbohydrate ABC transporter permease [Trueperaceae bacterium]|nr:carbohydrate ABC transporter permease [Trueperaceae bacterium]